CLGHFFRPLGPPPPLPNAWSAAADGAWGLPWPQALFTLSWGPTPTRQCLVRCARWRLRAGIAAGAFYSLVGPHPHSPMPRMLRAMALACWHSRRRFLLSRGAPPPLANASHAARDGACVLA